MLSEILVTTVIASIIFYYLTRKRKASLGKSLPGPWGLPLVGHLPFFGKNPPLTFLKWKRTYGPIYSVQFGSFPAVVLNDGKLVKEAFNLEAISGRPRLTNFVEMGGYKGIVFTDGPRQVEQRKFAIKALKEVGLGNSKMEFCLQEQISKFLQNFKIKSRTTLPQNTPIKISHFFRRPIVNSIWVAFMGKTFEEGDPMLEEIFAIFDRSNDTNETIVAQLSWFFPMVSKFLTCVGINRAVQDVRYLYAYISEHIERCRTDHIVGQSQHFTHMYFDQVAQTKDPSSSFHASRSEQGNTTGDIFMGAVDTSTTSMDWLLIHLAREPEVQEKLQSEIDSVLGAGGDNNSRIPSLSDRTSMPYTEAVIQELFRMSPSLPLGVFRRTMEDVQLQGYNIPKNTMVFPNIYGIHRDPEIWFEPNKFMPERFLDEEGRCKKVSGDILSFSSGKRSCIGEAFGRDQIFLIATSFFQKFTVSLPNDRVESVGGEKFGMVLLPPSNFELVVQER